MRKYDRVKKLSDKDFQLATGVRRKTFEEMLKVLKAFIKGNRSQGGAPKKLRIEDCLLMSLEYLREYRTLFHISLDYGISVATVWRTCRWVENTLIKSKSFSLPGKKALKKSDMTFEVIMMDATESPIERPKKKGSTWQENQKSQ